MPAINPFWNLVQKSILCKKSLMYQKSNFGSKLNFDNSTILKPKYWDFVPLCRKACALWIFFDGLLRSCKNEIRFVDRHFLEISNSFWNIKGAAAARVTEFFRFIFALHGR